MRLPSWLLAPGLCLFLAGCGSSSPSPTQAKRGRLAPPAPGNALSAGQLRVQLANGFRVGLYRVAVMSQAGDEAADLGQQLPTASVRNVACRPARAGGAAAREPWRCQVRWETVEGARRATSYAIRLTPNGCFRATAQPALTNIYDSTIRAYADHPLNEFTSSRSGC